MENMHSNEREGHYIVAIGASAGGLEAINDFFDHMHPADALSFIVIQHLSSNYQSKLVELVSRHTPLQVIEAQDDTLVEKGKVYVIPNDQSLRIENKKLLLADKEPKGPNTVIDIFLHTLAKDQGAKAICVILSGTGSDGMRGAMAIHDAGGYVIAQDPESAKFDGMPYSIINAGIANAILTPDAISGAILQHVHNKPGDVQQDAQPDENDLHEVLKILSQYCDNDFSNYKKPALLRRIASRMAATGYRSFAAYFQNLKHNKEECVQLSQEFLINVTDFFRDEAAFELLRNNIIPDIIAEKKAGETVRVWVVACSSGQEAYSIAMLMNDAIQASGKQIGLKVLATDIDTESLEHGANGGYMQSVFSGMNPYLLEKYFVLKGDKYTVIPELRKKISFKKHNILADVPYSKIDLLSCRNMLIYMDAVSQKKVLETLHFAMTNNGYLFLGSSEVPTSILNRLEEIDSKWKIYRRKGSGLKKPFNWQYHLSQNNRPSIPSTPVTNKYKPTLETLLQHVLTEEYGFAAVLVDVNAELKQGIGSFRKYLSLPQNLSGLNLLRMVEKELAITLRAAMHKAKKENISVTLRTINMNATSGQSLVNIHIKPIETDEIFIVFSESHTPVLPTGGVTPTELSIETLNYIGDLENNLDHARSNLQNAVDDLESANQELQCANEELISGNEELQSTNEELQALNEELHTLNAENRERIKELTQLNDDLDNYFKSSPVGKIFLDAKLRIRKYNPAVMQFLNILETDIIGRPITDLSIHLLDAALLDKIQQVATKQRTFEEEIILPNLMVLQMRLIPYIQKSGRAEGVVIVMYDITTIKHLDHTVKTVFDTSLNALLVFKSKRDIDNTIIDFICTAGNQAAAKILGLSTTMLEKLSFKHNMPLLNNHGLFEKLVNLQKKQTPLHTEIQVNVSGKMKWYEVAANKMLDGFLISLTDTTDKKNANERLLKSFNELIQVKQRLKQANADLEHRVLQRTLELSESEERFRLIANAASDVIWDWNLVTNEMWWSESFFNLFGLEKTNDANSNAFRLRQIHPDDRLRVVQSIQDITNGSVNKWNQTYRFQKGDGNYAMIIDKGSVLRDEYGIPYRMTGSMTDVTELNKATNELQVKNEALSQLINEFQFLADFVPQMIWSTKPNGEHDYFNRVWNDFTGLNVKLYQREDWKKVLHPDDFVAATSLWYECLRTGQPYETKYRMRRYDGKYFWFLTRSHPLRNESGEIIKWFGTSTDVHEDVVQNDILEHKVEERTKELKQLNAELEIINAELLQFASIASHDLKEPLRKIHIFSNILKDRYGRTLDKGAADYIDRIIASSSRMTRLINDLLTFSRLSVDASFESTDLNEILNDVISDLELLIQEKKAVIETGKLPVMDVIPGQIRQVFQNLISNALKFSKVDVPCRISITCSKTKMPQDAYAISVADNGIGFDNQYSKKIFAIFQRLHVRDDYEGTGIGLAITKKIIEKHNGSIVAESRPGEGARFTFTLPVMQPMPDANAVMQPNSNMVMH